MRPGVEGDAEGQLEATSIALLSELKHFACGSLTSCQVHGEVSRQTFSAEF